MKTRVTALIATAVLWAAIGTSAARAQKTSLDVVGFPIAFPSPTGADFYTGYIDSAGSVSFTVDATTGTAGQRTTTVSIRCNTACPQNGGPKLLSSLQWRRADQGTWNTLTTADATIETRTVFLGISNDPWTNSIFWRFNLDWLNDPPGASTNFRIKLTLTVTVP